LDNLDHPIEIDLPSTSSMSLIDLDDPNELKKSEITTKTIEEIDNELELRSVVSDSDSSMIDDDSSFEDDIAAFVSQRTALDPKEIQPLGPNFVTYSDLPGSMWQTLANFDVIKV
jgi:hypothetical protein